MAIVDLLRIDPETPLDIRSDAKQLIVALVKPFARGKEPEAAQEWAHEH